MIVQKFGELCRLYQGFYVRNRDYERQAAQFVWNFAAELAKQIDAPDTFIVRERKEKVHYVRPLKFDPDTGNFDPLGRGDLLRWVDNEGAWHAGVGIHLEPAKNAFPKTEFTIRLQFKLHNGDVDLQIPPNGAFAVKLADRATWQPALEYTIKALVITLNLKSWEPYEHKEKIGFVWHDRG
jgi:hypothetical protein